MGSVTGYKVTLRQEDRRDLGLPPVPAGESVRHLIPLETNGQVSAYPC